MSPTPLRYSSSSFSRRTSQNDNVVTDWVNDIYLYYTFGAAGGEISSWKSQVER